MSVVSACSNTHNLDRCSERLYLSNFHSQPLDLGLSLLSKYSALFLFSLKWDFETYDVCFFPKPNKLESCVGPLSSLKYSAFFLLLSKPTQIERYLLCLSAQIQITSTNIMGLFPRSKYLAFFLSFKTELSKDMSGFVLCASSKFTKKMTNVLCARLQSKIPDCLFMF